MIAAPQIRILGPHVQALGLPKASCIRLKMTNGFAVLLELFALSSDTSSCVYGLFLLKASCSEY